MSITREEQMKIKKETTTLLAKYKVGSAIKLATDQAVRDILGLRPTTRIANSLHRCSVPEGMDPDCFRQLADIRSKGFELMNGNTQEMVSLWDPQIKHIIETEYSSYMRYEQALYQEGVVCILFFMGSESDDAYEQLCSKISFQMFHP